MSVGGVLLSSLESSLFGVGSNNNQNQNNQNNFQQIQSEFQQLGQDIQSGNLTQADQDYTTLTQELPGGGQNSNGNSTIAQAFSALGQALQSGNVTNAQQAFATLQQDIQQAPQQTGGGQGHHHHHGGGGQEANSVSQAFGQLGQALQSGNLSAAQQAYSTIQSDVQNLASNFGGTIASGSTGNTSAVDVTA